MTAVQQSPPRPAPPLTPPPTPSAPAPVAAAPRRIRRWNTTPGRLTTRMVVLALAAVIVGAVTATGAAQRASLIGSVRSDSGPLVIAAQSLYRSLSDADATAAAAFLSAGAEPPALRTRYLGDVNTAAADLTAVSTSRADTADVRKLAAGLPVYTGLVETARADNRLGLPLGAAYLREASGQMRDVLLPAAQALYQALTSQLADDRDSAAEFPWLAIPLGILLLLGLVRAQMLLTRRTHRILNPGLLAATLATVAALLWVSVSYASATVALHSGAAEGSQQVEVLANARIDALRARADEALTLVARGNDPTFDTDYAAVTKQLGGPHGLLATALAGSNDPRVRADIRDAQTAFAAWQAEDSAMRSADSQGRYPTAVAATIGTGKGDAPALFGRVDTALGAGIDAANARFQSESANAADASSGVAAAVIVLTVIALAGIVIGYQRRIAEYR